MVFDKTIGQVVGENYVYARALHYLGIDFFESPNKKLQRICDERGLDRSTVIKSFYAFDSSNRLSFAELEKYPIELLTEYLKHAHHLFIKEKLPYVVHLVKHWNREDMASLLTEFVADFIEHIYEEEDSTFKYIDLLLDVRKAKPGAQLKWFHFRKNYSLKGEFESHSHDDEFGAIRTLMSSFEPENLHERVLLSEIQAFDREMIYHAEIENNIFFPKALSLESDAENKTDALAKLN